MDRIKGEKTPITAVIWWIRLGLLMLGGCFFLFFGIYLLIAAYHLKNPFTFVMTFFASNLIILISVVLLIGFVLKGITTFRSPNDEK